MAGNRDPGINSKAPVGASEQRITEQVVMLVTVSTKGKPPLKTEAFHCFPSNSRKQCRRSVSHTCRALITALSPDQRSARRRLTPTEYPVNSLPWRDHMLTRRGPEKTGPGSRRTSARKASDQATPQAEERPSHPSPRPPPAALKRRRNHLTGLRHALRIGVSMRGGNRFQRVP